MTRLERAAREPCAVGTPMAESYPGTAALRLAAACALAAFIVSYSARADDAMTGSVEALSSMSLAELSNVEVTSVFKSARPSTRLTTRELELRDAAAIVANSSRSARYCWNVRRGTRLPNYGIVRRFSRILHARSIRPGGVGHRWRSRSLIATISSASTIQWVTWHGTRCGASWARNCLEDRGLATHWAAMVGKSCC